MRLWQLSLITMILLTFSFAWGLDVGSEAPLSKVKTIRGEKLNLKEINETKIIMLDFFTTWCKPCTKELPILQEIYEKYGPRGFLLLGVSRDVAGDKSKIIPFVRQYGVQFPVYHDRTGKFARKFGVNAFPTSFIIDKDGEVKLIHTTYKPGDEEEFFKVLEELLPAPEGEITESDTAKVEPDTTVTETEVDESTENSSEEVPDEDTEEKTE